VMGSESTAIAGAVPTRVITSNADSVTARARKACEVR
jgi:hypothetical protein